MSEFIPYRWEAEKIAPSGLRYRVRLADHVLTGTDGKAEATMFSWSYLAQGGGSRRPVVFAYNGGPGAASAWLHMGLLGPVLAQLPEYPDGLSHPARFELTPNPDFLLDQCDIVLIDPVGTGWAQLLDENAASRHYSTAGDARDFVDFICAWLAESGRENAPVYLLGESYGTIRNVALADVLPETVDLRGIIHVGTSLNVGARTTLLVEPNVRRLGANAAVCWYHHHQDECSCEDFVAQAMDFAYGAHNAPNGRSIIAVNATAKGGSLSRISAALPVGSAVSIPRNIVDYVVTEFGIARLRNCSVRQRVENLIAVAHPDFRAELARDAQKLLLW